MTSIPSQVYVAASDGVGQVTLFSFEPLLDMIRDHALLLLAIALVVAFLGHAKVKGRFNFHPSMGVGCTWFIAAVVFALGVLTVWL